MLTEYTNEIQQWNVNTTTAVFVVTLYAICVTALTKMRWDMSNLFSVVVYALGATVMVKIGVFGLYAGVNRYSDNLIKYFRISGGLFVREKWSERKLKQAFYRSCACIKIRFGSINFVERTTPLKFVDISNTLTVNFLLVK